MTIHDGRLYKTKIVSIIKGTEGTPGEFIGTIDYQEKNFLGSIRKNTVSGIFGTLDKNLAEEYELEYMQVGYSHEVEKGKAYIRMYTDNSYQDYQIEIDHISYGGQKNLTFTVKSPGTSGNDKWDCTGDVRFANPAKRKICRRSDPCFYRQSDKRVRNFC